MADYVCSRCGDVGCECNAPKYKEHYIPIKCKDCNEWYEIDKLGGMGMGCPRCALEGEA